MRTMNRKLLRELQRHWVQVTSIALVMGCGIMTIMGLRGTLASVRAARDTYFETSRFADVFASVQRAPAVIGARIAGLPGVAAAETRIVRDVKLDIPGLAEPGTGHVVSIPDESRPMLNAVHVRRGRWIAPGRADEILISERFARLNGLLPGDSLSAVVNGRWQRWRVVGIALSPEFVIEYAGSATFADNRRFGIVWTSAAALETAFDMKGAFNDVVVRLAPGASEQGVMASMDQVLRLWGGGGAYGRADQASARVLEDEFKQLRVNASVFPVFFLIVGAFLLSVIMSRLVASQRDEIAALKAFGYSNMEIGIHYLDFGLATVAAGTLAGIPAGMWMGAKFTALYAEYFRFPVMPAAVDWNAAALAVGVSAGFALLGALGGVHRVMRLPPAEALRPEAPAQFRPLLLERLGAGAALPSGARMVFRNLERRPLRTGATVIGVALAVAMLAAGRFPYDAFQWLMNVEFRVSQRYDAMTVFANERPSRAALELASIPGVTGVELFRSASVRIERGAVKRTTMITGIEPAGRLFRLVDGSGEEHTPGPGGVFLGIRLARVLGVRTGDTITLELLDRGNQRRRAVVTGLFDPTFGQGLYATRPWLNSLLREQDAASGAYLAIAPGQDARVFARFKGIPGIAGATSRAVTIRNVDEQMRESMTFILTLIITSACIIAAGVVYNSARIALSERGRELASLRVLGFTTAEVGRMLLGEQTAIMVVAMPLGVAIGAAFSALLVLGFESERFRFPFVVAPGSQLFAMSVVFVAGIAASLVVRRRVGRLNLVSALRTRE